MTMQEVIENELKCVQRDCCRLENECAKCDLVLPKEEIINAYNKALKLEKENAELKDKLKNLESVAEVRLANWQKYEKENAELKEKFLKVKKDDVRKSKLDSFKTFEEKNEYLRQVATYAIFNEDIGVMLWCFIQRDNIYKDRIAELKERADKADLDSVTFFNQLCKAKEIIKEFLNDYPVITKELLDKLEQFIKEDK